MSFIMSPTEQREELRTIMFRQMKSLDWLAGEVRVPTEQLRRWLERIDPETNRQRYEWHNTHEAVTLFLATYE
jgi:hypothetical protein